jgi:hypothetical protein
MGDKGEDIPSQPLMMRRRILGYLIPGLNLPLFFWNLYQTIVHLQAGLSIGSTEFMEEVLVSSMSLGLTIFIPRVFPVYESNYSLLKEGLTISRFMKGKETLPYKSIDRAEVFMRVDESISKESRDYAMDTSANLRKSGFKFKDYTNSEEIIVNLFVGKNIYMISPAKPKTLLKDLKRRNNKLTARIVELAKRGKRVQDLE